MQKLCHILSALPHDRGIVFLAVSGLYTVNVRAFLFLSDDKADIRQISGIQISGLCAQLVILF